MKQKRNGAERTTKQFVVTRAVDDATDPESNSDTGTITVEVKDRGGDIVVARGGELENFLGNPVVLYAHNAGHMPGYGELPVARATKLTIENDRIKAEWEWAPHAEAQTVKALWRGGFLNAISIGFLPKTYEYMDDDEDSWWPPVKYLTWELLEFSIVPIPANQEALRNALDDYDAGRPSALKGIMSKAGRVLSAANELNLKSARDLIDGVLAAVAPSDEDSKALEAKQIEPATVDDNSDPAPELTLDLGAISQAASAAVLDALTAAINDALASALGLDTIEADAE